MAKRVTLVEAPHKRAMMEQTMRYEVRLDGEFFSDVFYNMRGFIGAIPVLGSDGKILRFHPGECSLAKFRKEIAASNMDLSNA